MNSSTLPPESRIASFLALFVETHAAKFREMHYEYGEEGEFPDSVNRFDPDPTGERSLWEPNTQMYQAWLRALEKFATKLHSEHHPLDIHDALGSMNKDTETGHSINWLNAQPFPRYFRAWCSSQI